MTANRRTMLLLGVLLLATSSCLLCTSAETSSSRSTRLAAAGGRRNSDPHLRPGRDAAELTPSRRRRSPLLPAAAALMGELRISGSKSEPPSRPSVDWSKQRPYFGPDMQRNVSVELGKTAYLVCKVYELGDKTVSWLRPQEKEILTSGRFTYIGDSRFTSINDNGSHDWTLEIKDVGLNDSTSYECQVSTDPKMSTIIHLQVKAAKARIKQGEQFYAPLGSNIEFVCDVTQGHLAAQSAPSPTPPTYYWYHNGNLLNYAKVHSFTDKSANFTIDWDPMIQASRIKLYNVLASDAGNYTCKPTSAEPATIRLHVKKPKNGQRDRTQQQHHAAHKDARNRQHYGISDYSNGLELIDSATSPLMIPKLLISTSCLFSLWLSLG